MGRCRYLTLDRPRLRRLRLAAQFDLISACFARPSPRPGSVNLRPARGDYGKMAEEHEILTAEEAAALLRVSSKTLLSLARNGALPGEKVGRAWRFLKSDVLAYVRGDKDTKAREEQ
ncbi:helix-turn-helix domain-containing protein [Curtobacterium sp. PhB130]|uniref:helix-turn-helix domain-containing protein n=1 Tax=Curtobacterium sp. PhB130 TaxID=2485178 RepID=UPI00288B8AEB|nr:helix-turn-helix domain-containing protein [Curtobacterium sp. PhB130]